MRGLFFKKKEEENEDIDLDIDLEKEFEEIEDIDLFGEKKTTEDVKPIGVTELKPPEPAIQPRDILVLSQKIDALRLEINRIIHKLDVLTEKIDRILMKIERMI